MALFKSPEWQDRPHKSAGLRKLAAACLDTVDGSKAGRLARYIYSEGFVDSASDATVLWVGKHLALVHVPGSSVWAGIGQSPNYHPQHILLVEEDGRRIDWQVQEAFRKKDAELDAGALNYFWEGARGKTLSERVLKGLVARAKALDLAAPQVLKQIEENRIQSEHRAEEEELQASLEREAHEADRLEAMHRAQELLKHSEDPNATALAALVLKRGLK
jgi:hypothetical protein